MPEEISFAEKAEHQLLNIKTSVKRWKLQLIENKLFGCINAEFICEVSQ